MSRGLGKLQREVLRLVDDEPFPTPGYSWTIAELTAHIFGDGYTDTQRRSVHRAAQSLQQRGLVELRLSARRTRPAPDRPGRSWYDDLTGRWHRGTHRGQVPIPETEVDSAKRLAAVRKMFAAAGGEPA